MYIVAIASILSLAHELADTSDNLDKATPRKSHFLPACKFSFV